MWILFCLFQDKYSMHFANVVKKATPVYGADMVLKAYNIDGDVRIKYEDQSDFENIARQFGIFQEWKVIQLFLFFTLKG